MKNLTKLTCITLLFISLSCTPFLAQNFSSNLIKNGSFEEGRSKPSFWETSQWNNFSKFSWDKRISHSGERCVQIESRKNPNDARWIQKVEVKPDTDYLLSGWIKTENVEYSKQQVDAAANLCVYGTWNRTIGVVGSKDWTYVTLEFNSGDKEEIIIGCRLGYWSGVTKGRAWFDDICLVEQNKCKL